MCLQASDRLIQNVGVNWRDTCGSISSFVNFNDYSLHRMKMQYTVFKKTGILNDANKNFAK